MIYGAKLEIETPIEWSER